MYSHLFSTRNNFKQLIDFYYLLKQGLETEQLRKCGSVLQSLGIGKYAGGIVWIMKEYFGSKTVSFILPPNERIGKLILEETFNYGTLPSSKVNMFFKLLTMNTKMLFYFPKDLFTAFLFQVWHQIWRLIIKFSK